MTAFTRPPVSRRELAIVKEALDAVPEADDHTFLETDLIAEIVKRLEKGTPADKERRANELMHAHSRSERQTIYVPGAPARPAIPPHVDEDLVVAILDLVERRMPFADIDIMVAAHHPELTPDGFKGAWDAVSAQLAWKADYHQHLHKLFDQWDTVEREKGRPENELVFGNFVRETGLLRETVQ